MAEYMSERNKQGFINNTQSHKRNIKIVKIYTVRIMRIIKYLLFHILLILSVFLSAQSPFSSVLIDREGPERPWGKCFGDLNNDGLVDLIIGGYIEGGLVYYENPTWQKKVISDQAGFSTDIEVHDIDGDHDLDVFCVRKNTLEWFENPAWNSHVIDSVICHDLELSDFDQDGRIDIVARDQGEFGHRGDTLFVYIQANHDEWKKSKILCADGEGLKVHDINKDFKQDIIINGSWFENSSDMLQWKKHAFTDTWDFKSTYIDVGDINCDGREDIILSPSELKGMHYRLSWFEAPVDRSGIWNEHIIEDGLEAVHHFVGVADFDIDGNQDVATAEMLQGDNPDEVKIYFSDGTGRTWSKQVLSDSGCHSMRIMDIDNDGDMDLFGANHNDRIIRLWVNQYNSSLSVRDNLFYLDYRPFGMWGLRTASASQNDELTNYLIDQLDDYKNVGLNTISVYIQGSSGGYSDPFSDDGKNLDPFHAERLTRIIEECNKRSMVVIVGIFYQRVFSDENAGIRNLQNAQAIFNAVQTVTELLKPYRNVIINIANEQNSGRYKNFLSFDMTDPENVIALCKYVKEMDHNRIVGAGGYDDLSNIDIGKSEFVDVLLFDTWSADIDSGHTSGWHYDFFREQGVPDKPFVNVEIFGGWTKIAMPPGVYPDSIKDIHLAEIDEAVKRPGLSVHFHSNPWCQGPSGGDYPIHYELGGKGTADDPGIRWWFEYAQSKSIEEIK